MQARGRMGWRTRLQVGRLMCAGEDEEWHRALRRTTPMGTGPWPSVTENERGGIGGIGPESGTRCSSSSAGSQPGAEGSSRRTSNASATPSAATVLAQRFSPSDSTGSTSLRRGVLPSNVLVLRRRRRRARSGGRHIALINPAKGCEMRIAQIRNLQKGASTSACSVGSSVLHYRKLVRSSNMGYGHSSFRRFISETLVTGEELPRELKHGSGRPAEPAFL